jgi:hypothetical protein
MLSWVVIVYPEPRRVSLQPDRPLRMVSSRAPLHPLLHLTPLFPSACGLSLHNGRLQPLCLQSLPDSFHRNGSVYPPFFRACPKPIKNLRPTIHFLPIKGSPLCTVLVQCKSFKNNTCKSVTKQTTLTLFRINTYEKHGGRGGYPLHSRIEDQTETRIR